MRFYLGTHQVNWLWDRSQGRGVPLFVSRRRLAQRKTLRRAAAPWALDSGGFTELSLHGRWLVTPAQYCAEVRRYRDEIGSLEWAAPQDWMCEPQVCSQTFPHLSHTQAVEIHQRRSVDNYLELRALAPDLPWVPVLQGWTEGDYLRCAELFEREGVDLRSVRVGIGTVCRRGATAEVERLVVRLHDQGIALHGFGLKTLALRRLAPYLASSDSLAWSLAARKSAPRPGCAHHSCANCAEWAHEWRAHVLRGAGSEPLQGWLL